MWQKVFLFSVVVVSFLVSAPQVFANHEDAYIDAIYQYPYVASQPVNVLPRGYTTIVVGSTTYYYADGFFYQKLQLEQKYLLVPPPIGAVVYRIPDGYQMVLTKRGSYYIANGVSYRRTLLGYQVVRPLTPQYGVII